MQPTCIKCGQQHLATVGGPACSGHKKDGSPCLNAPMHNQKVCGFHGGRAPQNKRAAAGRALEREISIALERLDGRPVANPLEELAAVGGRARAWMNLMESRVQKLLAADDAGDESGDGIRYRAGAGEQLRAEVALYERAMDRMGRFLTDYGRLNIDDRLARITEKQAELVEKALLATLGEMGMDVKQQTDALQRLERHLRLAS